MKKLNIFAAIALLAVLCSCAEAELASHVMKGGTHPKSENTANAGNFKIGKPYKVDGQWYYPKEEYEYTETGIASWYGPGFQGKKTASGEIFDTAELTAAHRTLQMPSLVRVTNLDNGRSVVVRVNDRGPFKRGRVIDVSQKAAELLGFKNMGTAKVKLEVLKRESMQLAQIARSGQTTKGMEVAMNAGAGRAPAVANQASYRMAGGVPAHDRNGVLYPDPVVTQVSVTRTNIFVQAGSFGNVDNANRLSQQLADFGDAAVYQVYVNGRQFYRVRLGPMAQVTDADRLLSQLVAAGHREAIIVVE